MGGAGAVGMVSGTVKGSVNDAFWKLFADAEEACRKVGKRNAWQGSMKLS